jgi:hypothetical protein
MLLVPTAELEGHWTRRFASLCLVGKAGGVIVQLFGDHRLNHVGTDIPLAWRFKPV